MAKKGLGKGLGALIPDYAETIQPQAEQDGIQVLELSISDVEPNPEQPRKVFDEEALRQLADSILENGLIQPIIVAKEDSGFYRIISGERRWRASRMAGLTTISAIVRDYSDRESVQVALVENLQRENLNPIEEAEGYQYLMDRFDLTQEEVSERVGKSRSAVANTMRLLSLPDDVLAMLEEGVITAGHARALITMENAASQKALAKKIAQGGLSVRQTEQLAKQPEKQKKTRKKERKTQEIKETERILSNKLTTRVKIDEKQGKGKIEIEYYSQAQLTEIVNAILHDGADE